MALASLNLAASTLAALVPKLTALAPASLSAIIPAKLAVLPVIVGLAVGTAAGASFMATSEPAAKAPQVIATTVAPAVTPAVAAAPAVAATPAVAAAPAAVARPCEAQTWPYIEAKCMAGAPQEKRVRLVSAPRPGETTNARTNLVTRDTVLRQPQNLATLPPVETKPLREKRKDTRRKRDRRFATQSYQVPYERGHSGPVIVVRPIPMRLDTFR